MYWAIPRRIRLKVENKSVTCQISDMKSNFSVKYYVTKNYGLDYQEGLVTSINAILLGILKARNVS